MHGIVSTAFWGLLTIRFDRGWLHGYAEIMLRTVRLFWICLLVVALPLKAWALVSGAHCSSAQPVPPHVQTMSHDDTEGCPHHLATADGPASADPAADAMAHAAASLGEGEGHHHSCSACAHCSTASTLPSAWPVLGLATPPHTPPASVIHTWCSAAVHPLDRPPTHGVV